MASSAGEPYQPFFLRRQGIDTAQCLGRESDLATLHEQVEAAPSGLMLVVGMPGVGKTELLIQYMQQHRQFYAGGLALFSGERFGEELRDWFQVEFSPDRDLRHLRTLKQQVALGWKEWRRFCAKRPALVVIDDVTDYRQQVEPYLPQGLGDDAPFRIVITSRIKPGGISEDQVKELWVLAPEAAVIMLSSLAGSDRITAAHATAESLCERLGYLPLALALVGAWLQVEPERSLPEAVALLEQEGLDAPVLEPDRHSLRQTAERGLKAAFAISWQQAGQDHADGQQLARVLTLFAPVTLPWPLVAKVIQTYT
ncbi:MAG TPA: NB-ARC domain-containing protein, partial [Candidatus Obscuribacterales bacterium]